jgi:DNA-binding response OmpR family regulator
MQQKPLSGCRLIILEDDYYQAHDAKQVMESAGAQVLLASAAVADAAPLLDNEMIDAALIDINLGQSLSLDFARELRARAIPFAFLTGYDAAILPDDLADSPCLSKPADSQQIVAQLAQIARRRTD